MLNYEKKKVADLELIYIPGDHNGVHICLLHGYGANAFDLAPCSQVMRLTGTQKAHWYFPQAPLTVELSMEYQGNAWFPIDFEALEHPSSAKNYSNIEPNGMKEARTQLIQMLGELNLQPAETILGGFSQGAMMAVDTMLHIEESFKALVLFSGTLINQSYWGEMAKNHTATRFFQSHGVADPLLHISDARNLYNLLKNAHFEGDLFEFTGGHEIPHEVMSKATDFLSNL